MPSHGRAPARRRAGFAALALLLLPPLLLAGAPSGATDNPLPAVAAPEGMRLVHEAVRDPDTYPLPVRAMAAEPPVTEPPVTELMTGRVQWQAFRGATPATPLGAVAAAAAPLEAAGLRRVLDCAAAECGGFGFRLAVEVLPQPHMMLNPADFRQRTLSGRDAEGRPVAVSLLASRFGGMTHLQVVTVLGDVPPPAPTARPEPEAAEPVAAQTDPQPDAPTDPPTDPLAPDAASLAAALDREGRAVLHGLVFRSAGRGEAIDATPVLDAVAALMAERPALALVVVGHSDGVGSLAANIRLSRQRAEAVVAALAERGVARARLTAEGAGWLSPVAPNETEEGRAANRRVEIVAR